MSALLHQFAGQALIFYRVERIASGGNFCQAGNLYWHRGAGLLYLTAKIVPHDPNMAQSGAGNDYIPGMQCAVLYQNRSHRATAFIQLCLNHGSFR